MRIRSDTGERMVLSGPPGGLGTVVLMLVVGVALGGGGIVFSNVAWSQGQVGGAIATAVAGLFGIGVLLWGLGTAITRDRLELDAVTRRGRWTRRMLGRDMAPPFDFDFERARSVQIQFFVDATPTTRGQTGSSSPKVRARLRISKPRRTIDLDEAEEQREPRVRAVAERVAEMLEVEVRTGRR